MSLAKAMKNLKFDKRMSEWSINNGQMTKEEFKKHLDELPDLSKNVLMMTLEDDESDQHETH